MKSIQVIFLILLCILFNLVIIDSSSEEDIPYLYYFSRTEGNLVIERADGTDSQVIAEIGLLPSKHVMSGAGWSVSDNWFAWYPGVPGMLGSSYATPEIVSRDGNLRTVIYESCSTKTMEWSSSRDLLLLGCFENLATQRDFSYIVYDAHQLKPILVFDSESFGLSGDVSDITHARWTPNGENLVVYHANSVDVDETKYTMKVFALDGTIITEREFYTEHLSISQPFWSVTGNVIYSHSDNSKIVVENFQNDLIIDFDTIGWVDWSPNGDYAFIYGGKISSFIDDPNNINPVWLLSLPDEALTLLSRTARPLHLSRQSNRFHITTTWSPTNELGFIVDSSNSLSLVSSITGETIVLHTNMDSDYELYPQFVRWHNNGERLTLVEYDLRRHQGSFYVYDVNKNQLLDIFDARVYYDNFAYSYTGQVLAYGSLDCEGVCILDHTRDEVFQVPFFIYTRSHNCGNGTTVASRRQMASCIRKSRRCASMA